jgi:hypothetical protein
MRRQQRRWARPGGLVCFSFGASVVRAEVGITVLGIKKLTECNPLHSSRPKTVRTDWDVFKWIKEDVSFIFLQ